MSGPIRESVREASSGAWNAVCLGLVLALVPDVRAAQDPAPEAPADAPTQDPEPPTEEPEVAQEPVLPPALVGDPPPGEAPTGIPGAPRAAAPTGPLFAPAYRSQTQAVELCRALAAAAPQAARSFELTPAGGAPTLVGVEFGRPGPVPLEQRPTLLVLGGLDGVSLAGGEAAFAVIARLTASPERLPEGVAFVVVPWAAPGALARLQRGQVAEREPGAVPIDEDRDGRFDEDGPDDVDGDGLVLEMLIEDRQGPWTFSSDPRFLVPAAAGDGVRYLRVPEGRDDDGDGRYNEDGPGGVALDRNFPLGRENAWRDPRCGPSPLCDPTARALADLALARRTVAVLLLQGHHGGLALPGGAGGPEGVELPLAADRRLFERAADAFAAQTARSSSGLRTLREARGEEVSGAALDWFYAGVGALALEVAPWGPFVEVGGDVLARDARFAEGRPRDLDSRPAPSDVDLAWGNWLDDTRGGLGFVEWHPVDVGGGVQALVGGWEPHTQANPPPESLGRALLGIPEFVLSLAAGVPRLELRDVRHSRAGNVVTLHARVKNAGVLPTGLAGGAGPRGKGELVVALELPPGARLLAGRPEEHLGRLEGGELSRELTWIVLTPEGASLALEARCELALPQRVQVQP
ncbi:MAG TPA: hypothetical protein VMT18_11395 [Planctomycetota bacterium]|nr:hypothetical protein [Planctomycetota bacterium]